MAIIKDSLVDLTLLSKSPNGIPMILVGDSQWILRIAKDWNYQDVNLNLVRNIRFMNCVIWADFLLLNMT